MSTYRLYLFGDLTFIGPWNKAHRYNQLVNKWDSVKTEVVEQDEDGMTYGDNAICMLLDQDQDFYRDLERLYAATKRQGKTPKTTAKKVKYLRKGLLKLLSNHGFRVMREAGLYVKSEKSSYYAPTEDCFDYSSDTVSRVYINYYFADHDRGMGFVPLPMIEVNGGHRDLIAGALRLERNNKGNAVAPKLDRTSAEVEIEVRARCGDRQDIFVSFEWNDLPGGHANTMCHKFRKRCYSWDEKDNPAFTKLRKAVPGIRSIYVQDSGSYHDGGDMRRFYMSFHWHAKDFTWERLLAAEAAVVNMVEPEVLVHAFRQAQQALCA